MNVLVTGASGFIGQACLDALEHCDITAVTMGRRRPDDRNPHIEADILMADDLSSVMESVQPTHLLHLAWYADHGKFWDSPLNAEWVSATERLVGAFCNSGGKHTVFAGTCAEYDWSKGLCREDDTPLSPASLYGKSKVRASKSVAALCNNHGVRFAWGRIFQPFGPHENRQRLVPALIDTFTGRREPFGINGTFTRDFTYSRDVARAFVTLLSANAEGFYNITSGNPVRLSDVARKIAQICNTDASKLLSLPPIHAAGPGSLLGTNDKLTGLGWSCEYNIEKGVREMLGL
jgi:nucleoside-diphosphate-sugar epimerase